MAKKHHVDEGVAPETTPEATLPDISDEALAALCSQRCCPACPEKAKADEERLRALAEMENVKKRLQREKDDHIRYAAETVLADILPTLDNLDLAIQYGGGNEACKNMLIGVEMTRKLLLDAIARHGLEALGSVGEPFSPELHEAMGHEDRDDLPEGTVSTLLAKGYRLKERLLRPAKVMVSKKPG